jgi:hypothetical protein
MVKFRFFFCLLFFTTENNNQAQYNNLKANKVIILENTTHLVENFKIT